MPVHHPTSLAAQVEAWVLSLPCQVCLCEGDLVRVGKRRLCVDCCGDLLLEQPTPRPMPRRLPRPRRRLPAYLEGEVA